MAVTFPAWWTEQIQNLVNRYHNIEDVMIARFSEAGIGWTGVTPVYWLPTDEQTQQVLFADSEAFLRIYRVGGEPDIENKTLIHRVQFAAISESRNLSWKILALTQRVLYSYERAKYVVMPDGERVSLEFIGETLGPLLDPQQIRDARLVSVTVEVATPWPKGVSRVIEEHLGI